MRTGRGHGDRRQAYGQPRAQLVEMIDDAHARVVADLADRDCHAVGLLLQRRSRGGRRLSGRHPTPARSS